MTNSDDLDVKELKRRIVNAAAGLFEKKGRQATVDEIARGAGISVPVTYQFLKRPADIMLLIMEDLHQTFAEATGEHLAGDPKNALSRLIDSYFRKVDQQRSKVMLVYRSSRALDKSGRDTIKSLELKDMEIFRSVIERGMAAGEFQPASASQAAYNIVMLAHMWVLKQWYFRDVETGLDRYIDIQTKNIMAMLGVPF